ncbi:MAG: cell surface receptor domain protein [Gemmatimonadetes bacterium]|nr:cell surface receptor domain protein [Gemmatimonadota bacterium]
MRAAAPLALVLAAACGGGDGPSASGPKLVPVIGFVSPDTVPRGAAEATVAVTGTGFTQASVVRINGADRPTQLVSGTELRVRLQASDLAAAGIAQVTASAPGGVQSGAAPLVVANPVPRFTALSLDTVEAGATGVTVTITGANFFPETTVWSARGTLQAAYVSSTEMRAALAAGDLAQPGIVLLYVSNPEPGGGTVNTTLVEVVNPVPVITAISPTGVSTRSTGTVTLTGTHFAQGAVAYVGPDARLSFHPASATQMQVDLAAADVAASGTLSFRVRNPGAGGFSNTVTLDVIAPAPVATSLLDAATFAGQPSFPVAVNGSGFVVNSVLRVNGEPRSTLVADGGNQVSTLLTGADLASPGVLAITVSTPAPGGGVTSAMSFTVTGPSPRLAPPAPPVVSAPPPG